MTHPSKQKGNRYENELVHAAHKEGLSAERAYASNGRALGCVDEVDCLIGSHRVQAKIRKHIADYLHVPDGCDAVCFRQTSGPIKNRKTMVLLTFDTYLSMLKDLHEKEARRDNAAND